MRLVFPWRSLFLFTPSFLAGCALTPPAQKNNIVTTVFVAPMPDSRDARAASFLLAGRAAVKGGKESFSGGVQWRHADGGDEILLLSPLGQTLAQIQLDPDGASLTTSEHQSYYAADVESLTEQVMGWHLPLMGLQYWIQGTNSPVTAAEMDLDSNGRIVDIRQDGWNINYANYFPASETYAAQTRSQAQTEAQTEAQAIRPRLLLLKRGNLQIKLVIDSWNSTGN